MTVTKIKAQRHIYRVAQKSGTFHFHSLYRNTTYTRKANVIRQQ